VKRPTLVRAAETIENAGALDATIADTNRVVSRVLRPGALRDLLHGVPLGHPAHPIAVLVPAGAWISAAILDFVPGQQRAARTLVGAGLLGVVPAAAAGITDWSMLTIKQQRVGIVHWAANLGAVALYSASYIQRSRGKHASGKALGLLGLGLVSGSGYLGGHLAYRQGANVLHPDEPDFAEATGDRVGDDWQSIGLVDEFQEGKPSRVTLAGVDLLVLRRGLEFTVTAGGCSFCDDDLSKGKLEESDGVATIECAQDGSVFDIGTGAVVRGPATADLPLFDALVQSGEVEIRRRDY
jgi:nitrite reductase/ring-hydroxylating ferredoxin subunit